MENTEAKEIKYLDKLERPREYDQDYLIDFVTRPLGYIFQLFDMAQKVDEDVELASVGERLLVDCEDTIIEGLKLIEKQLGEIKIDYESQSFGRVELLGVSFTPADVYKETSHFEMAQQTIKIYKEGAFATVQADKHYLSEAMENLDIVISHCEEVKTRALDLKAEAENLLANAGNYVYKKPER